MRITLCVVIAFMTGLFIGFAHGSRSALYMADRWFKAADGERRGMALNDPRLPLNSVYVLMRRCAGDAKAAGQSW